MRGRMPSGGGPPGATTASGNPETLAGYATVASAASAITVTPSSFTAGIYVFEGLLFCDKSDGAGSDYLRFALNDAEFNSLSGGDGRTDFHQPTLSNLAYATPGYSLSNNVRTSHMSFAGELIIQAERIMCFGIATMRDSGDSAGPFHSQFSGECAGTGTVTPVSFAVKSSAAEAPIDNGYLRLAKKATA